MFKICLFLLFISSSFAKEYNSIYINPLDLLIAISDPKAQKHHISYERIISQNQGIIFDLILLNDFVFDERSSGSDLFFEHKVSMKNFQMSFKQYFSEYKPESIFLEGGLSLAHKTLNIYNGSETLSDEVIAVGAQFCFGYKWVMNQFLVEVGLGAWVSFGEASVEDAGENYETGMGGGYMNVKTGFAF